MPPQLNDVGGLEAEDFELISLNGFDPADNVVDINDYAWSMEYFVPDGQIEGYIYVGTGNDMIGLIYQGISAVMGQEELGDISVRPPEIRRYRDDISPLEWERVFDYRDVETESNFTTIGFRYIKTYRAQSDGVNYLYAATMGEEATLWRTAKGDPGTWEIAWLSGDVGSVRWMEEHNGIMYIALANEVPKGEQIGKIWATDGDLFWPVIEDGFGNPENKGMMCLTSYNGWLYAGTRNPTFGYEIWKLAGPDGSFGPIQILGGGGPSPVNEAAITPCVFKNKLYIGSQLNPFDNVVRGFKGADIIRIDEHDHWETVIGRGSITGYNSGFGHWPNTYIWSMVIHDGWFYVSTYDQVSAFFNSLENLDKVINAFLQKPNNPTAREANIFELLWFAGSDLYKSPDGIHWYTVTFNGLGDVGNYGFRTMLSVGGYLYLGTTNPFDGLEIWRGSSR
jgi:hypothetical protein